MVFHIRQIIRTALFVLAGILLILLLVWILTPNNDQNNDNHGSAQRGGVGSSLTLTSDEAFGNVLFVPGTYNSAIVLDDGNIYITVTVDAFNILDIQMSNISHAQQTFFPLFEPVMELLRHDILYRQTTNIPLPDQGPMTGQVLLEAINLALNQAFANPITTGIRSGW